MAWLRLAPGDRGALARREVAVLCGETNAACSRAAFFSGAQELAALLRRSCIRSVHLRWQIPKLRCRYLRPQSRHILSASCSAPVAMAQALGRVSIRRLRSSGSTVLSPRAGAFLLQPFVSSPSALSFSCGRF